MITFSDFQNPDPDTISFTISNASSSFVNALRRTIITDVQTVSFNVDDYTNSDLQVIKNTSSVHNEFILHRLGLLPINFKGVPKYNPATYKFVLNVTNKSSKIMNVTTKDIKVINIETNTEEDTNILLLPCYHAFNYEYIKRWLTENSNKCPTCRAEVAEGIPKED